MVMCLLWLHYSLSLSLYLSLCLYVSVPVLERGMIGMCIMATDTCSMQAEVTYMVPVSCMITAQVVLRAQKLVIMLIDSNCNVQL